MRRLALALAVLIGLGAPAWGQDFAKGLLAYGQHDHPEAVKWYSKAAVQGLGVAQAVLGLSYFVGKGVTKDFVQAHMWCNLAATSHPPGELSNQAVKNCDIVAKGMTPAQISEAQRLAREWTPKK